MSTLRAIFPLLIGLHVASSALASDFLSAAQGHIAEREYWASRSSQGLQAPNRRHGLRTYFEPEGIRVVDRTAPGAPELLSLRLEGLGRGTKLAPAPPAEVHHERSRVELRRPGLVEWYENRENGIEQGFTLTERPRGEGTLVLALHVANARAARRGAAIALQTATGRKLAYGKLEAFDATGRSLPVELTTTSSERIELRVDDAGASYPLVVDPLLTETDDTLLEADQADATLGSSVSSAGDVNGDGYADVIVGAPGFDSGEIDEGAAFIFAGGPDGVADATPLSAQTQIESNQTFAGLGSVASAGDVNGDGYDDVIVGADDYDAPDSSEGAAFVFLGGPTGIPDGNPSTAHAQLESNQSGADFGESVASAGDVNGDGYADLIVGAPDYDAGETDEGAAFVFLGSSSGITNGNPATAHARLESDQSDVSLGQTVASAGDVNGDGYADVIVGAASYDAGETDEGAAFVFLGSATGITNGNPSTAHAQLESNQSGSQFGRSVASAGDVDGDGHADVIVGAWSYDNPEFGEGAAFVFLGSAAGVPDGDASTAHALIESNQVTAFLGWDVASAGDVNGDGYSDVIVAAVFYSDPESNEGVALVYLGSQNGIAGGDPSDAYAQLESNQSDASMGWSVASAGDVNGDGYSDVVVGARAYDNGELNEGAAFIFHGGAHGLEDTSAAAAATQLESNQPDAELGTSVASAGDVNGDGYGDVIVGAKSFDAGETDEGAAFVFLGTPNGIADAIPSTAHAQLESNQAGGGLGSQVASAGDVNGDGYDDVIVGTDGYANPEAAEGVAFVFHGSAAGIADGSPSTAAATLETDQIDAAASFGTQVASAGDVNADGYADVVIGAPYWDSSGRIDRGIVLFFYGGAGGVGDGSPATADEQFEGVFDGDLRGSSVASAGDVNGDGFGDVIVGAFRDDTSFGANTGSASIIRGGDSGLSFGGFLAGVDSLGNFGHRVASAGDVNGDGFSDVIVGAPAHGDVLLPEGAAFVFLGSATGVAAGSALTAHVAIDANQLFAQLGRSVASAGDVNGDGFGDVIVGAPLYDNGESNEGTAFLFLGSDVGIPDGDVSSAAAWIEGDQADARLGQDVASAGDVNGDGFADLIVGAHSYDVPQTGEGAAFVFLGGDGTGRPVLARQLEFNSGDPIPAWGAVAIGVFDVSLRATHPAGRGLAKLEVEWCPAGLDFDDVGCGSQVGATWSDVTATPGGVTLTETISGLTADTLYRWRARVLHASFTAAAPGVTPPLNPAHGPWRRPTAQAREADVRVLPEPGALVSLLAGGLLLATLHRRRRTTTASSLPATALLALSSCVCSSFGAVEARADDFVSEAQQHIAAREYWASRNDQGLQAPNRRHDLRTYFGPEGIRVMDRTAPGAPELLSLRLEGVGRGTKLAPVPPAEIHHERSRVELRRPGLVEWYENGAEGLEQGFTLERRPEGSDPLVLALRVSGSQVSSRGGALALETVTGRRLAYGKLLAFDDAGRALPAELASTSADSIELRVDDAGADYPIVIDPLLTSSFDAQLEPLQSFAEFGTSVASAGDVNGDGYSDVIVGAKRYDSGQNDEGAAFIFLGSAAGIGNGNPATAHAQLESDQANATLGSSVASAGDVNGDGYTDVIVGADAYDDGESGEGAAFVFLGSAAGIVDGSPATAHAQLESDQLNAALGREVASAGDVNGDGYSDVIVSASGYSSGESNEGIVLLFLGSAAGISDGTPATADTLLQGNQVSAAFGASVASAGDVDGDGYADVVVGAQSYSSGESREGAAFVYRGSATGIADGSPATADAQIEGDQVDAELGGVVASAGDVNGDGYSDVIVGATLYDAGEADEGAAFVFLGSASGIGNGSPTTADAQLEADQAGANLGWVASAGDVNGDGFADVIVGAFFYMVDIANEGAAFVFLGGAGGIPDASAADAYAVLPSGESFAVLGFVASAGDVDGDGFSDVIVGAPGYDLGGAAFIYHGGGQGLPDAGAADAETRLESDQDDAELGISVASAGDVNGDGHDDVIVGAWRYDAGEADEGAAFVFLGSANGIADASPGAAHAQLESDQIGGGLGFQVATAGDVNGDGYDDVIVGTFGYDNPQAKEGVAFVFHGGAAGIADGDPATADATLETDQANAALGAPGTSVASIGDMNCDGFGDVAIGAPFYDDGTDFDAGLVLLFFGGAGGVGDGTPATADVEFIGGDLGDRFGTSVASAGDTDGDGCGDVIIGSQYDDTAGGTDTGSALVVEGNPFGSDFGVHFLEGDDPLGSFGYSVASAGDVNGDGFSDVIVGAHGYDHGLGNEGAAFVFLGSTDGVGFETAATADATLRANQVAASFGISVASAGDVNGDGYADVIAGASRYDNGETDEGAAFVFLGSETGIADGDPGNAATWIEGDQAGAELGRSVASAGDVDGDGFAEVLVGARNYDAGQTDEGAAFLFVPGTGTGRPAAARQLDTSSGDAIPAWGATPTNGFDVSLRATHPAGRGLVKAEVEWCPAGLEFGDVGCGSQISSAWTDVTATPGGVTLAETITGLTTDTLYRWRVRVLRASLTADAPGVTPPPNPAHGPWRRPTALAREADVRALPEPGTAVSLLAGGLFLALLRRARR